MRASKFTPLALTQGEWIFSLGLSCLPVSGSHGFKPASVLMFKGIFYNSTVDSRHSSG